MSRRMLAVVMNGAREREVDSREAAIAWARSEGVKTVDLWTVPDPAPEWRWLLPRRIFDDGTRPIEFNVEVPQQ